MRGFVILCLVAFCAADVSELGDDGYNYQHPEHAGHESGLVVEEGEGGGSRPESDFGAEQGFNQQGDGSGYEGESFGSAPSVSKRFFSYTAVDNDHDDDDDDAYGRDAGHKHYDVVFAHAPTPSVKSALKAFAKYAGEHQTAVYVLNKKLGADEIGDALRASGIKPNKPHVHFIKYKTPEEAAHAQEQVKAQYDALGGHSEFGGEESARVHSVVGSLGRGQYRRRPSQNNNGHSQEHEVRRSSHAHHRFEGSRGFSSGVPALPFSTKRYLPPRH